MECRKHLLEALTASVEELLHVHMIVFLAGFSRDSDEMVKMMVEDVSFKDRLLKYFSSVVYCSALDEQYIVCPCCSNQNSLEAINISETAYMNQTRKVNPVRTSQCKTCSSVFGGDEVRRYLVHEMRKTISMSYKGSILADDSTSGTGTEKHDNCSTIEDGEYVALRAAIPVIPDTPPSDCSDHVNLSHKLYTTQLLIAQPKHN